MPSPRLFLLESDLFRSREELVEEAYERQGRRIAWVEAGDANDAAAGIGGLHGAGGWS